MSKKKSPVPSSAPVDGGGQATLAKAAATAPALGGTKAPTEAKSPIAAKSATKRTRAAVGRPKANRGRKRSGMSGLDAAAKVLADAGKPLRCQDVVDRVLAKGLWKTSGKTPAATIHSAVIREIKLKGKESRFKKAGRGLFVAVR